MGFHLKAVGEGDRLGGGLSRCYHDGQNMDSDTRGVEQARLLVQSICGSPAQFRDVKELRVRCVYPENMCQRVLTREAQKSQHMVLASMAVALQSLQVCISHMYPFCMKQSLGLER